MGASLVPDFGGNVSGVLHEQDAVHGHAGCCFQDAEIGPMNLQSGLFVIRVINNEKGAEKENTKNYPVHNNQIQSREQILEPD